MKLSDAIRLGAMLRPQAFGELVKEIAPGVFGTCAFGAAEEAICHDFEIGVADATCEIASVYAVYRPLLKRWSLCPVCTHGEEIAEIVHHLNDWHRWTRERIAEWVATIEPQDVDVTPVVERTAVRADEHRVLQPTGQ